MITSERGLNRKHFFPVNDWPNQKVFSLKPFAQQEESLLKISAPLGRPFRRNFGTNKQTDRQTQ